MSLEWIDVELKDVLSEKGYIRGPFGSALKRNEMKSEGIPVYEQQNAIYDNREFRYFIDEEKYKTLERFTTKTDDLIISCSGTVGKVSIIKEEDPKGIISQALLTLRVNKELILPEFLKYFFSSYEGYNSLVSRSTGSVQVNISKRAVIEQIPLKLPPLSVQEKIVHYLSLIDKKISINTQINHNLDKTIRELYNSWFVDFLPFQNQEFKDTYMGKIPNEWEIKNLDEICDKISDSYKPDSEEVVLIQTSDVSKGIVLNHEKVPNDDYKGHFKYKFEKNDILYTQIRPKNERYAFINFDPINYVASTQLMVLRAKSGIIPPYILYLFLTSRDMIMEVNLLAESRSGTFPQINFNEIKHEKVIVAPFKVYESFWNIIRSLVEKKFINDDEIIKLTQLRDILLPKLMSGEIDVSQINCDL